MSLAEVHHWISPGDHRPGLSAYFLDNGSLFEQQTLVQINGEFSGGGSAGKSMIPGMVFWNGLGLTY